MPGSHLQCRCFPFGAPTAVFCAVLLAGAMPLGATPRATPEQMQALAAKEGGQLLADPAANYRRIVGLLIRPGAIPDAELITRFTDALAKADTASRRARLHYLLSNTYYWQGFRELRKARNRAAIGDAVPQVMSHALAAFEETRKAPPAAGDTEVAADAEAFLRTLLRLNLYGADLPPALKEKVIVGFLDVLEKAPGGFPLWPAEERAAVYRNLGVAKRLGREFPETLPDDPQELRRLLKLASAGFPQQGLRYAEALESRLDLASPTADPAVAIDVFDAYRAVDRERALRWLTKVAACWPVHYLTLFEYTADPALKVGWPERMAHLRAFLAKGTGNCPGCLDPCLGYDQAVAALMREKQYPEAIECLDTILARSPSSYARLSGLWYAKGQCHVALGQNEKARQAFQQAIDRAGLAVVPEWSKARAEKALAEAGGADKEAGGKNP